jgi:hypothetical protein
VGLVRIPCRRGRSACRVLRPSGNPQPALARRRDRRSDKDHIFQSIEFLFCAFALLGYAREAARARRWRPALGFVALALLFLADIIFVVTGRSALLVVPVLLLLLGF